MSRQLTAAALLLALAANPSKALDTGHHADLTRAALSRRQFSDHAIKAVQVANWLTDYLTNSPTVFNVAEVKQHLEDLHFDNLFSTAAVENYWRNLAANTRLKIKDIITKLRTATRDIATADNTLATIGGRIAAARGNQSQLSQLERDKAAWGAKKKKHEEEKQEALTNLLVVIGISLHAVQDFYSHSNWAESQYVGRAPAYQTVTWWRAMAAGNLQPGCRTGWYQGPRAGPAPNANNHKHGTYDDPQNTPYMNQDSYCRPHWDRAYVFAYAGSLEWIDAVIDWADEVTPGLLQQEMQNYDMTQGLPGMPSVKVLDGNLAAAKAVSEYVNLKDADGHWKGKGSGWIKFVEAQADWFAQASPYVFAMKGSKVGDRPGPRLQKDLIPNLYKHGGHLPSGFVFPPLKAPPAGNAVSIRTTRVTKPADTYVFARITVDERPQGVALPLPMTYDEALVVTPSGAQIAPRWHTIHFADANVTSVRITYKLVARTSSRPGEGRLVLNQNQNRPDGEYILEYDLANRTLAGDVVAQNPANGVTLPGPNQSAIISVSHEQLW